MLFVVGIILLFVVKGVFCIHNDFRANEKGGMLRRDGNNKREKGVIKGEW